MTIPIFSTNLLTRIFHADFPTQNFSINYSSFFHLSTKIFRINFPTKKFLTNAHFFSNFPTFTLIFRKIIFMPTPNIFQQFSESEFCQRYPFSFSPIFQTEFFDQFSNPEFFIDSNFFLWIP